MTLSYSLEVVLVASIAGMTALSLFTLYLQDKLTDKVEYLERSAINAAPKSSVTEISEDLEKAEQNLQKYSAEINDSLGRQVSDLRARLREIEDALSNLARSVLQF